MRVTISARTTADEFVARAMQQPEGQHYGFVGMAPERAAPACVKHRLREDWVWAIRAGELPCEAFPNGMSVRVDADTVYPPDALVRGGPRLDNAAVEVTAPLIVVAIVTSSFASRDSGSKLEGCFRLPPVRHHPAGPARDRADRAVLQ